MNNFHRLCTFNALPLLHQVLRQPKLWQADTYLRDYPQGPFGDTQTVFLRFPPVSVSELERSHKDQHESVWMDGYDHLPAARELIFNLMTLVSAERLGRVMINKLKPGGVIYPHADTPAHAEYWDRYHFCLTSASGCNFRCGDETVHMQAGELWWFAHALEHEVINNSDQDRIHMICDLRLFHASVSGLTPTGIKNANAAS